MGPVNLENWKRATKMKMEVKSQELQGRRQGLKDLCQKWGCERDTRE